MSDTVSASRVSWHLRKARLAPTGRTRAERTAIGGGTGWYVAQQGAAVVVRVLDDVNEARGAEAAQQIRAALESVGYVGRLVTPTTIRITDRV